MMVLDQSIPRENASRYSPTARLRCNQCRRAPELLEVYWDPDTRDESYVAHCCGVTGHIMRPDWGRGFCVFAMSRPWTLHAVGKFQKPSGGLNHLIKARFGDVDVAVCNLEISTSHGGCWPIRRALLPGMVTCMPCMVAPWDVGLSVAA